MKPMSNTAIRANVRPDGALCQFTERAFDLMLGSLDNQDKQLKEARRILKQIGYEVRNVKFDRVPGN